jgi:hypothetical protein
MDTLSLMYQQREIGATVFIESNQLAIEYESSKWQSIKLLGYVRLSLTYVILVASVASRRSAISNRQHPEAVVLDL